MGTSIGGRVVRWRRWNVARKKERRPARGRQKEVSLPEGSGAVPLLGALASPAASAHEVTAPLGVLICDALAPYWLQRSPYGLPGFPGDPWGIRSTAVPASVSARFILPQASARLQRMTEPARRPCFRTSSSFHEVLCLIARSASGFARHDGFHAAAAFRPRVFATPRRFAPQLALRVYFTPLARPGLTLQGLSLSRSRPGSSPCSCPLVVTHRPPPVAGRHPIGPASGPCSPRESVAFDPRLNEPPARSPRGLSPLQGLLRLGRRSRFRDPPLASLYSAPYRTCAAGSTGCSRAEGWDRLSRGDQPS